MRWVKSLILVLFFSAAGLLASSPIVCEGTYSGHLQGVAAQGDEYIFWSFTNTLVKTDMQGKILAEVKVDSHSGDLCIHENKVYVAVNLGKFNQEPGQADSWVYIYDSKNLGLQSRFNITQAVHGAGGMEFNNGFFYVVGGLPEGYRENYVYQYDPDFNFVKRHVIASGHTLMGIQTACFSHGYWWFGCYGNPRETIQADPDFYMINRFQFDCSLGLTRYGKGLLVAEGFEKYRGRISFIEITPDGR